MTAPPAGITIASTSFLPRALVLARGWAAHHGQPMVVVHESVQPPPFTDPAMRLVPSSALLPAGELAELRALCGRSTPLALKSWALLWLLSEGARAAVFVDADSALYGALGDVGDVAAEHGLVTTHHLLEPVDAYTERIVALAGSVNSGFLAAGPGGHDVLAWWAQRCGHDVRAEPDRGVAGDQRWLDMMLARPEVVTSSDPGLNVSWTRMLGGDLQHGSDGAVSVGGRPLRHLHTGSAFDPERPWTLGSGVEAHGLALDRRPVLRELLGAYAAELLAAGHRELKNEPSPGVAMADGTPVDATMRALYRSALLASRRSGDAPPPGPFDGDGGEAFRRWLRAPVDRRRRAVRASRYLLALADAHPTLRAGLPTPIDDADGDLEAAISARVDPRAAALLDSGLRGPGDPWSAPPIARSCLIVDPQPGLAGWTHSGWAAALAADVDPRSRTLAWFPDDRGANDSAAAARLRGDVWLIVANPARWGDIAYDLLVGQPADRRRIGWWPDAAGLDPDAALQVDEIWVADEDAAAAARAAGVRARVVPTPRVPRQPPAAERIAGTLAIVDLATGVQAAADLLDAFRALGSGQLTLAAWRADEHPADRTWLRERSAAVPGSSVLVLPEDPAALAAAVLAADALIGPDSAHVAVSWAVAAGIPVIEAPAVTLPERAAVPSPGEQAQTCASTLAEALAAVRSDRPIGGP